jgi:GDP-mannose 6-dehydrogenase
MNTASEYPVSQIAVLGLGYVGCVTAACFAKLGHTVIGVDSDEHKVKCVREARAPFHEPGLEPLIHQAVAAKRLCATVCARQALAGADIAFICVGTPSQQNGNLGLEQLERVAGEIRQALEGRSKPLIVALRSTVFPKTAEEVLMPALNIASDSCARAAVVSNPEFLREGSAIQDFMNPSLVVVGGEDRAAVERVAALYSVLDAPTCQVSLRAAEMIKYACNAFHAVKIAFANEIGSLAQRLGVDPLEVMETLCRDGKLNASGAYLKPGFAFGGSCLPKDLRALNYRASRLDLKLPLLEATLPSNREHLHRAMQTIYAIGPKRLGFIGLAFKEDTDDVRESPVVGMLEHLIGKGRDVRVFDPNIRLGAIYGSNRRFILLTIPHIGKLMDESIETTLGWADHLVVAQKQKPEVMERIRRSGLPVTDLIDGIPA